MEVGEVFGRFFIFSVYLVTAKLFLSMGVRRKRFDLCGLSLLIALLGIYLPIFHQWP